MITQKLASFDEDAKRAVVWAAKEVERYRHRYLKPEHLLLGILRTGLSIIEEELSARQLDPYNLERMIRRSFKMGTRNFNLSVLEVNQGRGNISFTKKAATALIEARHDSNGHVSPDTILHALLEKSSASLQKTLRACRRVRARRRS